jgi:hypothetical protein
MQFAPTIGFKNWWMVLDNIMGAERSIILSVNIAEYKIVCSA